MNKQDVINTLSLELYNVFKKNNVILAGGSIRSIYQQTKEKEENYIYEEQDKIQDLDIYFKNTSSISNLEEDLLNIGYKKDFYSINATSFARENSYKIQLIILPKCIKKSPLELIKTFDFSVCSGAFDFETEEFVLHENFKEDNNKRILRYNIESGFPICALIRINKYINKKSYKINSIELLKIALCINNLKIENYKQLKEQLNGIDTSLLQPLTDNLLENNGTEKKYDFSLFLNEMNNYLIKQLNTQEEE